MTTTEDIIVSGEDFIERRIVLIPEQTEIDDLQASGYKRGFKCGWRRGLLMGLMVMGVAVVCVWLALSIG
jgi:hypothetical protein